MAKTKPIGVRFDIDQLARVKLEQGLETPQQVVNYLLERYVTGDIVPKGRSGAFFIEPVDEPGKALVGSRVPREKKQEVGNLYMGVPIPRGLTGIAMTMWKDSVKAKKLT